MHYGMSGKRSTIKWPFLCRFSNETLFSLPEGKRRFTEKDTEVQVIQKFDNIVAYV